MDPFDDFEMKPLTEGLGFHKKKVDLQHSLQKSGVVRENIGRELPSSSPPNSDIDELMSALDKVSSSLKGKLEDQDFVGKKQEAANVEKDVEIIPALPRKSAVEARPQVEIPWVGPDHLPPLEPEEEVPTYTKNERSWQKPINHDVGARRGAADSPLTRLTPAVFSLSSAFLDAVVVVALSLIFLVSLLVVTGVELASVYRGIQADLMTQLSMILLYVAVLQMYVVVSRSFFGRTLGEWTFDFQMGDDRQIESSVYPILVLWRSIITVVTGVAVLPLLSLIFRVDLASYVTGLQLYKKQ